MNYPSVERVTHCVVLKDGMEYWVEQSVAEKIKEIIRAKREEAIEYQGSLFYAQDIRKICPAIEYRKLKDEMQQRKDPLYRRSKPSAENSHQVFPYVEAPNDWVEKVYGESAGQVRKNSVRVPVKVIETQQ